MANLSDLDTSNIGWIAYWNATEHGVTEINPTEVLANPNVQSYTQYDNGVEGVIRMTRADGGYVDVNFRVKGDGWFITWLPRYTAPETDIIDVLNNWNNASDPNGYYNLIWDWTQETANISTTQTLLERAIQSLASYLSNWSAITYAETDVGHYNYDFGNATAVFLDSEQESAANTILYFDGGISFTSGVSLYYARAVACTKAKSAATGQGASESFEGVTIISPYENSAARHLGSINILPKLSSAGVFYSNGGDVHSNSSANPVNGKISHIVLWS